MIKLGDELERYIDRVKKKINDMNAQKISNKE
jgi:hypothetical protein